MMEMDIETSDLVYRHKEAANKFKVNMHCRLLEIVFIREILTREGKMNRWEVGCFGHFMQIRRQMQYFSGKLCVGLLCRELVFSGSCPDELWFDIGNRAVRFGKQEFLLCTGLKFGRIPTGVTASQSSVETSIHGRYFKGSPTLLQTIRDVIERGNFTHEDDVLKMAYIFFVGHVLMGRDYRKFVPTWLWVLVEDLGDFESFPWGTFIYSMTLHWLSKAITGRVDGRKNPNIGIRRSSTEGKSVGVGINIYGFPWALQWWAMETIPGLTGVVGVRVAEKVPRCVNWFCGKKPQELSNKLRTMSGDRTMEPTAQEVDSEYWRSFDPEQMVTTRTFKLGGLHHDSEDDSGEEGHIDDSTRQNTTAGVDEHNGNSDSESSDDRRRKESKFKKSLDHSHDIPHRSSDDPLDVSHRSPNRLHCPPDVEHHQSSMDIPEINEHDSLRMYMAAMIKSVVAEMRATEGRMLEVISERIRESEERTTARIEELRQSILSVGVPGTVRPPRTQQSNDERTDNIDLDIYMRQTLPSVFQPATDADRHIQAPVDLTMDTDEQHVQFPRQEPAIRDSPTPDLVKLEDMITDLTSSVHPVPH